MRFKASAMWARCAGLLQHPSLLEVYEFSLELLPRMAWLGLQIHDRHRELIHAGAVTRDAAATAIEFGWNVTAIISKPWANYTGLSALW